MEITLKNNYGFYLIVKADNVNIEEDIETREYLNKDEEGKIIYTQPTRDISTSSLDMISRVLDDMMWYRKEEYDSSDLIRRLLGNLPEEKIKELIKHLNENF